MYIVNGTVYTMDSENTIIEKGAIRVKDGILVEIGKEADGDDAYDVARVVITPEENEEVIDAKGGWILPGLVEAHCHIGIQEEKKGMEGNDCNETVNPVTPWLRALDAINPMDAAFKEAVRAGITCVQVTPGSSNVVGGQAVVMKTHGRCVDQMLLKAPSAMKVAFGENPKVNYSGQNQSPATRMAIAGLLRQELLEAGKYCDQRTEALEQGGTEAMQNEETEPQKEKSFEVDFTKECWVPVFAGEIPVKAHVHRVDDIFTAIRIAEEFGLQMTLDHCSEGHLIAEELAGAGYPAIVGPDFASRNKIEVQNAAFKTAGILHKAGIKVAITTDHPVSLIQSLPLCAGMAVKAGMPFMAGLRAITADAAEIAGVLERVGSLEVGKDADISIFNGNPMEILSETLYTIIDGKMVYQKES